MTKTVKHALKLAKQHKKIHAIEELRDGPQEDEITEELNAYVLDHVDEIAKFLGVDGDRLSAVLRDVTVDHGPLECAKRTAKSLVEGIAKAKASEGDTVREELSRTKWDGTLLHLQAIVALAQSGGVSGIGFLADHIAGIDAIQTRVLARILRQLARCDVMVEPPTASQSQLTFRYRSPEGARGVIKLTPQRDTESVLLAGA